MLILESCSKFCNTGVGISKPDRKSKLCDKHTIKLRLEKRVTGKDRKALVIHTHAQRTRSIYDDIPTLRVPDGCRRMLAVYERNQR